MLSHVPRKVSFKQKAKDQEKDPNQLVTWCGWKWGGVGSRDKQQLLQNVKEGKSGHIGEEKKDPVTEERHVGGRVATIW